MNPTFLGYFVADVPALQTLPLALTGRRVVIVDATHDFFCKLGNQSEMPALKGFEYGLEGNDLFQSVTLRNPSAVDQLTVKFYYGTGNFVDRRLNLVTNTVTTIIQNQDAPTLLDPSTLQYLSPGGQQLLDVLTPPAGCLRRRSVTLTNSDESNALVIANKAGTFLDWLLPKQTKTLETSDAVRLINNTAGVIACSAFSVWYTT